MFSFSVGVACSNRDNCPMSSSASGSSLATITLLPMTVMTIGFLAGACGSVSCATTYSGPVRGNRIDFFESGGSGAGAGIGAFGVSPVPRSSTGFDRSFRIMSAIVSASTAELPLSTVMTRIALPAPPTPVEPSTSGSIFLMSSICCCVPLMMIAGVGSVRGSSVAPPPVVSGKNRFSASTSSFGSRPDVIGRMSKTVVVFCSDGPLSCAAMSKWSAGGA